MLRAGIHPETYHRVLPETYWPGVAIREICPGGARNRDDRAGSRQKQRSAPRRTVRWLESQL